MKADIRYFLITILLVAFPKIAYGDDQTKIGLLAPFTGEFQNIGKSVLSSARIALNKINNDNISILPRDTNGKNNETLRQVKELYDQGVRIFIGPVFNKNLNGLDKYKDAYFLSLTNKILNNPSNVISAGINARSQFNAIKKYQKLNNLEKTLILIPKKDYKEEIELAIKETKFKAKKIFYYDIEPTKLTKQIEEITKYQIRKQNLNDEIKRIENSDDENKEKKLEILNKRDTLGKIGYDSVVIADFDESLKSVTTSLLYTDVSPKKIKFISLNQWFDETLFKETASQPISFPSINKKNFDQFKKDYKKFYKTDPNQLSLITYDLVGLVYYLLVQNNFEVNENIFKEENKIKGKSGIFEIKNNKINHELNFYSVESDAFIKIF
tara:strand:- start:1382 stop:2530 length:1149 start_codon:yes stop_codon:yes gene_type:complete